MELRNLVMAWNGSKVVFSVTETAQGAPKGDVLAGIEHTGKPLNDWRIGKKAVRLSLDGEGKGLLAELENGSLLFYDDWTSGKKPVAIQGPAAGATLSPAGDFIVLSAGKGPGSKIQALSNQGTPLWFYPVAAGEGWKIFFPFLNQKSQVLGISPTGEVFMNDREQLLWKVDLQGTPAAASSSFLEGGVIAVSSGGDKGELRFLNHQGKTTGSAPFPGGVRSLSCSSISAVCAALSNGPGGQRLSVYTPQGKELWRYIVKTPAGADAAVVVAARGEVVIGGFEEGGNWSLRAWDAGGNPLWTAPIEGGLRDFKVSWNGKRIAVLSNDGRIAFYDLMPQPPVKEAK